MKRLIFVIILINIMLFFGCNKKNEEYKFKQSNVLNKFEKTRIELVTKDEVKIIGNYFETTNSKKGVILLHMLNHNKDSWDNLIPDLLNSGFNVLAIDFRGHGESQGDWKNFSEEDFKNMKYDALSGIEFLKSKGIENIYIIGASIGANTSIILASEDITEIKKVVALSPGLNYRGIDILDAIKNLKVDVLLVTSKLDTYSYSSVLSINSDMVKKIIKPGKSHGTDMISEYSELKKEIIDFLLYEK